MATEYDKNIEAGRKTMRERFPESDCKYITQYMNGNTHWVILSGPKRGEVIVRPDGSYKHVHGAIRIPSPHGA
jgi:hypothetical protein